MRVLLFHHLREAAGTESLDLEVEHPISQDEFWSRLKIMRPALARFQSSARLSRNCAYARPGENLMPDDEVGLIPPVSGG